MHFDLAKKHYLYKVINGINFFLKLQPFSILDAEIVDKDFQLRSFITAILNRMSPAAIDAKRNAIFLVLPVGFLTILFKITDRISLINF